MRRSVEEPENEGNAFQEAFRRKLHNYQAPVSPQEWNRLAETLDTGVTNERRLVARWVAAACLTLLVLTGSLLGILKISESKTEMALKTVADSPEKGTVSGNEIIKEAVVAQAGNRVTAPGIPAIAPGNANAGKAASSQPERALSEMPENAIAENRHAVRNHANDSGKNGSLSGQKSGSDPIAFQELPEQAKLLAANANPQGSVSRSAYTKQKPVNATSGEVAGETEFAARTAGALPETAPDLAGNKAENGSVAALKSKAAAAGGISISSLNGKAGSANPGTSKPSEIARSVTGNDRNQTGNAPLTTGFPDQAVSENAFRSLRADSAARELATAMKSPADPVPAVAETTDGQPVIANAADKPETATANEPASSKWTVAVSCGALKFNQNLEVSGYGYNTGYVIQSMASGKTNYRFEADREFSEETKGAFSWQTEVKAGYKLNGHFRVQSGLVFSAYATKTATQYYLREIAGNGFGEAAIAGHQPLPVLQAVFQGDNFPDKVEEVQLEPGETKYSYSYIGVPLELQYQTSFRSRWNIFAAAGATLNRLVKGSQTVTRSGETQKTSFSDLGNPFRQWQTMLNTEAGVSFRLNPKLQVTVGLEGNYFLQSLANPNAFLSPGKPVSFGLNTGLGYQF